MKRFLIYVITVAALWGCSDDPICVPDTDNNEINISAVIARVKPDAKTSINSNGTASWINGDSLGLFCPQAKLTAAANVKFTVSGLPSAPVWTPASTIYWADGTTSHTFLAYAPHASGNTSSSAVKLPSLASQTGSTINPAQDFLISNNYGTSGLTRPLGGSVGLTFTHAFTLINLQMTIDASITSGTTLQSVTLAGGISDKLYTSNGNSTIALSSGVITTSSGTTTNTLTASPASPPTLSATATNIYIIILPGSFTPTLQVTLNEGGTNITVPTANISSTTYNAGSKYIYTVSISRTAITLSNPTITDWTPVSSGSINGGI